MKRLNIVVIGCGMYVCGRGTDGYGTVMPAVCQWKKGHYPGKVYLAGRSAQGITLAQGKIDRLKQDMSMQLSVKYFPRTNVDNGQGYKEAIAKIPKPAAAIVVVPDHLHREVAGLAIENGLHTLVVKPLAPTLEEARQLIELQERHNVYCAVEFHKRLDLANLKMKDVLAAGTIGEPLYFLVEYSQKKSVPAEHFKQWVTVTNVFQYLGVHYVDIIYYVTGARPRRAMAVGQEGWLKEKGIDADDAIQGIVEWQLPSKKLFHAHILVNWIDPETSSAMSEQKIKVIGTRGRFESDQKQRGIRIVSDLKGIEEPNPYFCAAYGPPGSVDYYGYGIDSVKQFLDDVLAVEKGEVKIAELEGKRPSFRDALVSTAVIEAINTSLKNNGEWVTIPEDYL